jgi:hypothetical protein
VGPTLTRKGAGGEPERRHGSAKIRQRLLKGIYAGTPFRMVVRDLGLTSQQVWGLTKTDEEWSAELEAALTGRREDLQHGTNAAGSAEHQFSSIGILGARFGLRLSVVGHFAIYGRMRRSNSGVLNAHSCPLVACIAAALSAQPVCLVSCSKTKMQKGNR